MWSLNIAVLLGVVVVATLVFFLKTVGNYRHKAQAAGFPTLRAYLRATPRDDEEKRDAVDLALKGLVLCIIGLTLPPFLLIGVVPLFYGMRKILYTQMAFGFYEDRPSK